MCQTKHGSVSSVSALDDVQAMAVKDASVAVSSMRPYFLMGIDAILVVRWSDSWGLLCATAMALNPNKPRVL